MDFLRTKTFNRGRVAGALELAREMPQAAAKMALKLDLGLQGAVLLFDAHAALTIGLLDEIHRTARRPFDLSPEIFAMPDWQQLASDAGETLTAAHLVSLAEESRRRLGFEKTLLTMARVQEI